MPVWDARELSAEYLLDDVESGLFVLAETNAHALGTMKYQLADPVMWPEVPEGETVFVHKLARYEYLLRDETGEGREDLGRG